MNTVTSRCKIGIQQAIQFLKHAQCVFFDVDSTIIQQEGLDELARYLGKYDDIQQLTNRYC